jgi:hypothetical protein
MKVAPFEYVRRGESWGNRRKEPHAERTIPGSFQLLLGS